MAAMNYELNDFINEVCEYMRTWNSYASALDGHISLDRACSEPYADFKKQVKLFYRAFDPLHKVWFNQFFTKVPLNREMVNALLKGHCFKVKSRCKNVFIALLYICSFTYSLLHYCEKNKMDGMLVQIRALLQEKFACLEPKFTEEGKWNGLKKFCSSQNLPTLLQFIDHGYCEEAVFNTFILRDKNVHSFGLHGRETLDLLMNNTLAFEKAVFDAFNKEINADLKYREEVESAFSKLRSNLQSGPFQNILSQDRVNIANDPTAPLIQI